MVAAAAAANLEHLANRRRAVSANGIVHEDEVSERAIHLQIQQARHTTHTTAVQQGNWKTTHLQRLCDCCGALIADEVANAAEREQCSLHPCSTSTVQAARQAGR